MSEVIVRINLGAKQQVKGAIDKAVRDVFNKDILPEAVANSPATPEGVAYQRAKFDSKPHREGTVFKRQDTGHNRQSLDVEFTETPSGPQAKLFSQSGYGGYLEVGTSKMRTQPYIWPAWLKFKDKIAKLIRIN